VWRDITCGHLLTGSVLKQELSAVAQVTGWGCFDEKLAVVPGTLTLFSTIECVLFSTIECERSGLL
jgi:hypothetical protein